MSAVFWHAMRQQRVAVLSYGLGLALYAALLILLYPSVESTMAQMSESYPQEILEAFGVAGTSLSDPRGFVSVEFLSMTPLILGAFAVFAATGVLAGEESTGTMEFLAALPLSRRQLFVQKSLAVAGASVAIGGLTCLGWVATVPFVDLHGVVGLPELTGATFAQLSFVWFVAAAGLLLGAIAPTRSTAAAWAGVILIVSYLLVAIAGVVDSVEWLQYVSPYYYADLSAVLLRGVTWSRFAVLWSLNLVITGLALQAFDGREIGSERWQLRAILGRPRRVHPGD